MRSKLITFISVISLGWAGCSPTPDTTEKSAPDDRPTNGLQSTAERATTMNRYIDADLAIKQGNLGALKNLISEAGLSKAELYELLRTAIMPDSKTPRHSNQKDMVQALIDAGADIHGVPLKGPAPLRGAVSVNDIEIATLLLQQGADPNGVAGDLVRTPLQEAQRSSFVECEKLLRSYGAKD